MPSHHEESFYFLVFVLSPQEEKKQNKYTNKQQNQAIAYKLQFVYFIKTAKKRVGELAHQV